MTQALRHRLFLTLLLLAGAGLALFLPFLPAGPDIYVHILWPQQVARCLAQGQLPLWLPDLNAGFGSPGIRLYSPGGPVVVGVLGLILGDIGKALRLAWFGALAAILMVARAWHPKTPTLSGLLLWASPLVPFLLVYRAASSEVLALPLALWLLEAAVQDRGSARLEAFLWAGLWLLHAPTFMMTAILVVLSVGVPKPSVAGFQRRILPVVAGLALCAWHWVPLFLERQLVNLDEGLTSDIFRATKNFLFSPSPHDAFAVRRLGWLAAAWGIVGLMVWFHDRRRGALVWTAILLATPITYPLWLALPPLKYLQFPWRFLTPVSLLLPGALSSLATQRRTAAIVLFLLPHLWMPPLGLVRDPALAARESWVELGEKVFRAFSGNPLVVDAVQNRPAAFSSLATNLQRFGKEILVLAPGAVAVQQWQPLRRTVVVEAEHAGVVELRLLAYPFWRARVDGKPVVVTMAEGIVAVPVPQGNHRVEVAWSGNPATPWGWALALLALAAMLAFPRSGKP